MKRPFLRVGRQSQEGSVAVEAAVCISFILIPLIFFIFTLGRFFWHYTVIQKAMHDATLYMAKAPLDDIKSGAATRLANYIIGKETADLGSGTSVEAIAQCGYRAAPNSTSLLMGYVDCERSATPFAVQTVVFMTVSEPFYFSLKGNGSVQFTLISTMRHAGK